MPRAPGSSRSGVDLAVPHDPDRRRRRRGQLVEAVVPAEDQGAAAPGGEDLGHHRRHPAVGAADRRGDRAGRVGQRTEEVEDGGDAHLAAGCAGVPHARVEHRREEEPDPGLLHAPGDGRGGQVDRDTRAPRARRPPPRTTTRRGPRAWRPALPRPAVTTAAIVEMFTVWAPSPPVPTMSTHSSGEVHRRRLGEHLGGEAGDLLGRLPLGAQRDGEGGDLDRGGLAGHHLAHGPGPCRRPRGPRGPAAG